VFAEIRAQFFPAELAAGVTARLVDPGTFWPIAARLGPDVQIPFAELGLYEIPAERRQRSQRLRAVAEASHREHIFFYAAEGEPVGWSYGHMLDAITFFMSWSAVMPAYRRRGLYTAYLQALLPYLETLGYERVTSKHLVTNRPVLIAKLKAGFHITGLSLDERFGAQVTLAYFFADDRREGFARAFSLPR
jgi:GNAT superfamily N-acetyltransferase